MHTACLITRLYLDKPHLAARTPQHSSISSPAEYMYFFYVLSKVDYTSIWAIERCLYSAGHQGPPGPMIQDRLGYPKQSLQLKGRSHASSRPLSGLTITVTVMHSLPMWFCCIMPHYIQWAVILLSLLSFIACICWQRVHGESDESCACWCNCGT